MSDFPNSIYSPRTMQNRNGVEYDEDDVKTIFAEDFNLDRDEIVAIETTLGLNPEGEFDDVADRLDDIESDILAIPLNDGASAGQMAFWDGYDWSPASSDFLYCNNTEKFFSIGDNTSIFNTAYSLKAKVYIKNLDLTGSIFPLVIKGISSANPKSAFWMLGARRSGSSESAIQNGDTIAQWSVTGFGATKYTNYSNFRFKIKATQNFTDSANGVKATFEVCPNGSVSGVERMCILGSGNVGINKTNPSEKLDVAGNIIADGYKSSDGSDGLTTTFLNADGDTVTVKNGLITDIS